MFFHYLFCHVTKFVFVLSKSDFFFFFSREWYLESFARDCLYLSAIEANKKHICFALSDVVKDEYIYLLYTFVRRECFKFIRREKLFLKLVELTVSSNGNMSRLESIVWGEFPCILPLCFQQDKFNFYFQRKI